MMQHGYCGHQMHHMPMVQPTRSLPAMEPIICPPEYRYCDQFIPQEVPFIHPIVNVNREHIVPIPRHYFTETTENVMGAPATPAMPIYGPEMGRRRGRRPRF